MPIFKRRRKRLSQSERLERRFHRSFSWIVLGLVFFMFIPWFASAGRAHRATASWDVPVVGFVSRLTTSPPVGPRAWGFVHRSSINKHRNFRFSYELNGVRYDSGWYTYDDRDNYLEFGSHRVGDRVVGYADPNDPARAVVRRAPPGSGAHPIQRLVAIVITVGPLMIGTFGPVRWWHAKRAFQRGL